jgi:hypothetical protein
LLSEVNQAGQAAGISTPIYNFFDISPSDPQTPPSGYFLIVCLDALDQVDESNEANNCQHQFIEVFDPNTPYSLTVDVGTPICDDNGTPDIVGDDIFTATVTVTNPGGGTGFVSGTLSGCLVDAGSYGVTYTYGPANILGFGNNCSVATIIDNEAPTCQTTYSIMPLPTCSNGGGSGDIDLALALQQQVTGYLGGFHGWYVEPGPIYSYDGDAVFERTVPRYETRPDKIVDNADPKCSTSLSFPKPDCDPCSSITITPAPGQITIAGASAPHVLIKIFRPNWTVAFECLDNCPSPIVVDGLTAGPHYIQVKLIDQGWGEICYLEQTVDFTSFGGNGGTSLKTRNSRQRMAFDNIYPNPAKYVVTLEIYSKDNQSSVLDFYNQQGQSVHRMEVDLAAGRNNIELDVSQWKSGAYNIIGRGKGHPAYGRFLKVWED